MTRRSRWWVLAFVLPVLLSGCSHDSHAAAARPQTLTHPRHFERDSGDKRVFVQLDHTSQVTAKKVLLDRSVLVHMACSGGGHLTVDLGSHGSTSLPCGSKTVRSGLVGMEDRFKPPRVERLRVVPSEPSTRWSVAVDDVR